MNHQISATNSKLDKAMNPEQFDQLVEAIVDGKYSWACVLILRFAGYNPLHYIPYRTYNRLMKDNCQTVRRSRHEVENEKASLSDRPVATNCLNNISDLGYLELASDRQTKIRGGNFEQWFEEKWQDYQANKFDLI